MEEKLRFPSCDSLASLLASMAHLIITVVLYVILALVLQSCMCSRSGGVVGVEVLDHNDCLEYGYNPAILKCATCEHVQQVLGESSEAARNCLRCCIKEDTEEVQFAKAVLELDKRSVPFLPDIAAVIEMKKELHLKVRYDFTNPRLLMFKGADDKEPSETIGVHSWSVDTFKDYLQAHLISLSSKGKAESGGESQAESASSRSSKSREGSSEDDGEL